MIDAVGVASTVLGMRLAWDSGILVVTGVNRVKGTLW